MRIAVLINQYPKVSHSFIRREVEALEAMSVEVDRISVRLDRTGLADPADLAEADVTHGVLAQGSGRLVADAISEALRAPRRFLRALALSWRLGGRSERGRLVHLIYLAEASHIARRCRTRGTQHLHAHFGTNSATTAMLAAGLADIPWSFTVHGPEEFDHPGSLALDEKIASAAFTAAISSYGRSQLFRWARIEDWHKIKIVRCGLDMERFNTEALGDPPDVPHLVCVGRLCEQKGQLLLVEAATRVASEFPGFLLTLVGDGEMRPEIEARIAAHGLEDAVKITGWADETEVRRRILASRALVLGSFAEGLPVVIMEALALRRPVVSTYVAGIPELVDASCGWLIPAGDVEALADAMRTVLSADPAQLARMGHAGQKRVKKHHDQRTETTCLLAQISLQTAQNPPGKLQD